MENVVLIAGLACVIIAVAGGGASAFGIQVPVIPSRARQVILGVVGVALVLVGMPPQLKQWFLPSTHVSTSTNPPVDTTSTGSGTTVPIKQARVDVSGRWIHQQDRQLVFNLKQNGDAVASEGSFGHADGHFTGPNTFTLGWRDIGAFEGTVSNDTINWNPSNTSWKRLVADVDVSGGWVHQQNRQWAFSLSQDGDAVTSEGSLGHAEGHFTGPVTFSLTWANIGSFEGTVKNGMIYWTPGGTSWERQAK